MKNWHYIVGAVLALFFSQCMYWVSSAQYNYDLALKLPDLPFNPYTGFAHVFMAATQLTLVSLVAHSALSWSGANAWTRALWVFVGLSGWNQMVDAVFGDIAFVTPSEIIFFAVSLAASILTFMKWQKRSGSNL